MQDFNFCNSTRLIFGKESERYLADEIKKYADKVLVVHYGGDFLKQVGLQNKVFDQFKQASIEVVELCGVQPNPRLSLVEEGIRVCKAQEIQLVLAIGGGSVIDTAKAIAVGALTDHDVWDFYMGKAKVKAALPIGVILTIAASGSESSSVSVIKNEREKLKKMIDSEHIVPKFAVMNPQTTCSLPAYQTACGVSDILAHMMERYFTTEKNVEFTDHLLEGAMKSVIGLGRKILKDIANYDVRAEIMLAGNYAHNGALGVGRIEDWATHLIEQEVSAYKDCAHGAGLAIIFPAWMQYVYKTDIDRFVQFFVNVFGMDDSLEKEEIIESGIQALKDWYHELGMPARLSEIDVPESAFGKLSEACVRDFPNNRIGGFMQIGANDICEIYKLAL